jgi:hypothetical protein
VAGTPANIGVELRSFDDVFGLFERFFTLVQLIFCRTFTFF